MAFSYDHFPSLLDSAYLPSSPIVMPLPTQQTGGDLSNVSYCFPYYYPPETTIAELSGADAKAYDSSSSLDSATNAPSVDSSTCSEKYNSKQHASVEKKRKSKEETSFTSGQSKITKGSKSSKQDKIMVGLKGKESKKPKANGLKDSAEPPAGYIHVRARRGQATDSHSLAERVRREKISERMKMLQGLVPGCDKVTGKAHMLDEIINYVQSLQNQVEFLSMRLASLSPMVYGFGLDTIDYTTNPPEKMVRRSPQAAMATAEQRVQLEPTTFENGASTANYHTMDHLPYLLQGQMPTTSSFPQDAGSSVMQVGAVRQGLPNQIEFVNITSLL